MLKRAVHRFRQFASAVSSRTTKEDMEFARGYLTIAEIALFERLPEDMKKHSIDVSRRMLETVQGGGAEIDERALVRIGLLHDVGKGIVKFGVFERVFLVLIRRFFGSLYHSLASRGEVDGAGSVFRKFYIHRDHGKIAAKMLRGADTEEEVLTVVESHGNIAKENDPIELILLRKCDEGEL